MADNYLEDLINEYNKRKEQTDFVSEPDYGADPYRGLTADLPLPEAPVMTREDEIASELGDVEMQQKEHNLLKKKAQLAKTKVDNHNNEFNEYDGMKELDTPDVNSYEKDMMEPFQVPGSQTQELQSIEAPTGIETNTFRDTLGQRESSGNYNATQGQYLGKYQLGKMALQDLGYKNKDGSWTGKEGISSDEEFLANPTAQEKAMEEWEPLLEKRTKALADNYAGEFVQGTEITPDGLKAAAHLVGPTAVRRMVESGEVPQDALGTKATEYLNLMNKKPAQEGMLGQDSPMVEPGITRTPAAIGVPPKVTEAKAGDMVQTREDGVKTPQELLMEEYKKAKEEGQSELTKSKWIDAAANIGRGLAQYGSQMGAAEATRAGARGVTGNLNFKPIDTSSKVEMRSAKKLSKLQGMIDKLKNPPKTQIVKVDDKVKLVNSQTGEEIKTIGNAKSQQQKNAPIKLGKSLVVKQPNGEYKKVFTESEAETGKDDPNSPASIRLRKSLGQMNYDISPGMTYNEIMKLGNGLVRSTTKRESNEIRNRSLALSTQKMTLGEKERAKKWAEKHESDVSGAQKQVLAMPKYKDAMANMDNMDLVEGALKGAMKGDETALKTLGVQLAKAFGEKGALSESDVTRYIQSASLMGLVKSKGAEWKDAKLSKDAFDSIRNILTDMKVVNNRHINEAFSIAANNLAKVEGMNLRDAMYLVDSRVKSTDGRKLKEPGVKPTLEGKEVIRKGYNPKTNQTQLIYSDGTKEVVEGRK